MGVWEVERFWYRDFMLWFILGFRARILGCLGRLIRRGILCRRCVVLGLSLVDCYLRLKLSTSFARFLTVRSSCILARYSSPLSDILRSSCIFSTDFIVSATESDKS